MYRPVSVGLVAIGVLLVALGIGATVVLGAPTGGSGDAGTVADVQTAETIPQSLSPQTQTHYSDTETQQLIQQTTQQHGSPTQQQYVPDSREFDRRTFEITVHENGSATWTFRYEQQLEESDNETETNTPENFEAFAEEFESEETEFYQRFVEQAGSLTDSGSEITDREMDATNFDRRAMVDGQINPRGIVEMSFTWHGFAASENGTLVIGDVFQSVFLSSDQTIEVQPGDGLVFEHVEPEAEYVGTTLSDADTVRWSGEHEFLTGHPRVVLEYEDGGSGGISGSSIPSLFGDQSTGTVLVALALTLAVVAGLVLAGLWYRTRGQDGTGAGVGTGTSGSDTSRDGSGASVVPGLGGRTGDETTAESGSDSRVASAGNESSNGPSPGAGETADAGSSGPTPDPLSEDDLLTDEDRVVKLIRENGGRMKQVNIVDETGWSKSKVSMLLSEMEDDGTISKLRVGRENIISLEGFEPEATKSPFDEQ